MIKALIFCALAAIVYSSWLGSYTVTTVDAINYSDSECNFPPVDSTITITAVTGGMSMTKTSMTEGSVTELLTWPDDQNIGVTCFSDSWECVSGDLDPTTGTATMKWYYDTDVSDGCQVTMTANSPVPTPTPTPVPVPTPTPTPSPSPATPSWLGTWQVSNTKSVQYCSAPVESAPVVITTSGLQLQIIQGTKTWHLDWQASNTSPAQSCADYMCTSGSLYSADGVLTASIYWTYDTLYKCTVTLQQV